MPTTLWGWLRALGLTTLLGAVGLLGYAVVYRLPDLEKRIDKLEANVHDDMKATRRDIQTQMTEVETDVHDQLKLVNLAVQGLRINLVRLCAKSRSIDKDCDLKQVIAEIKPLAKAQAEFLVADSFTFTSGKEPVVVSNGLQQELPPVNAWAASRRIDNRELAKMVLWTSAADSAHWHTDGKVVTAEFLNGTAAFHLTKSLSVEESTKLLDSLNDTVVTLQRSKQLLKIHPDAAIPKDQK
jgi:hypothetical protein